MMYIKILLRDKTLLLFKGFYKIYKINLTYTHLCESLNLWNFNLMV